MLNAFSEIFQQIENKTNEINLLGDLNINLLQNGKLILRKNQSYELKKSISALVSKCKDFCQTFSLTEIINDPTGTTCSTFSLLDHILTNSSEEISQKWGIDVQISDRQLIYCTKKFKKLGITCIIAV